MRTSRPLALLGSFFILGVSFALAQSTPKDHYKHGEELLKQNQLFPAYDEFKTAAASDSSNKKYQKKLAEVGKLASKAAQQEAHKLTIPDPASCEQWLGRAVQYDSTNESAARELASIRETIRVAQAKAEEADHLLNQGDVQAAEQLLSSLRPAKSAIPNFIDLEKELIGAKTAVKAESDLEKGFNKLAMSEIDEAEHEAPKCHFVLDIRKKIRRVESENILQSSKQYSSGSMADLIQALQFADYSLRVDEENDDAKKLRQSASQQLADLLLGQTSRSSVQPNSNPRVSLERLSIAERWIQQDSRFKFTKQALMSQAYPTLKVRVETETPTNCPDDINQEAIRQTIVAGLGRLAKSDREDWTLSFRVKSPSCSQTDVPKQSVQHVNSTYVAGYNQVVNPVYTQLQQSLSSAQIELSRAEINNQNNPNFGTGLALGFARGKVNKLQRQLSGTPPYLQQEILQQYQVEKFVSLRSCQIESVLQVYAKPGQMPFATEQPVTAGAEDRRQAAHQP